MQPAVSAQSQGL
jgi:UDPglucose 6-dehydrogenase